MAHSINKRGECSCGEFEDHIIGKARTADDKVVSLWSDGLVTSGMNYYIKGIGRARSAADRRKDVEAGWLAFGDVELYDFAEVPALVKAARKAVRLPGVYNAAVARKIMREAMA